MNQYFFMNSNPFAFLASYFYTYLRATLLTLTLHCLDLNHAKSRQTLTKKKRKNCKHAALETRQLHCVAFCRILRPDIPTNFRMKPETQLFVQMRARDLLNWQFIYFLLVFYTFYTLFFHINTLIRCWNKENASMRKKQMKFWN